MFFPAILAVAFALLLGVMPTFVSEFVSTAHGAFAVVSTFSAESKSLPNHAGGALWRVTVDTPPKQHTLGHQDCPACEATRLRKMQVNISPQTTFQEAAEQWKKSRESQLSEGSLENYRQYIKALNQFFGPIKLEDIHIGNVEEYQELREEPSIELGWEGCGPSRINHEISCLQQILKRAGLWQEIKRYYEPLPLPENSCGIALESDEAEHLYLIASKKPKWKIAYCCALISANTTMGRKEIRYLQLERIDLPGKAVFVERGIKNKFRRRRLPLNETALWAMTELVELAHQKGSHRGEHYLLSYRPHIAGAAYDPSQPMGSWKTAWGSLRKEAGKKFPRLLTVRFADLRHHACTQLLEDPRVSERTVEEMMGHRINSRTKERYSHIRMQRKVEAVEILEENRRPVTLEVPKKSPQPVQTITSSTVAFLFPNFNIKNS